MSKLRFLDSFLTPLYLKISGRIVGAFSKITMAIYLGLGLLVVVSILLIVVLVDLQKNSGVVVRPEQSMQQNMNVPVENQPTIVDILPPNIPEVAATEKMSKMEENKEISKKPNFITGVIQLDFGWQLHPVYQDWRYHTGIDIKGSALDVVETLYKGKVLDIVRDSRTGLTVIVKDDIYTIYYGSLKEAKVSKGDSVRKNQIIGTMGKCDGEPYDHVHLGIKKGEEYIDPKLIIQKL